MKKTIRYTSTGLVYGNYWGGGKGAYGARPLRGDTKESIIEQAQAGINDGSLDSGMGYESLIGALLRINKITSVIIDDEVFINEMYELEAIGDIDDDEEQFLYECLHTMK